MKASSFTSVKALEKMPPLPFTNLRKNFRAFEEKVDYIYVGFALRSKMFARRSADLDGPPKGKSGNKSPRTDTEQITSRRQYTIPR